jgi:hypothetical protein
MFFVFPSGGKENNAINGISEHVGARTHTHTRDFQLQHVFPQPPFCTPSPQINYLPRPPILPRFCRPLIRHPFTAYSPQSRILRCRGILQRLHIVTLIMRPSPKNDEKGKKVTNCGSIHTEWSLAEQGGDVCKVWLKLVQKCEFV